ncbi:MAG TPA: NADH-quinone oxidoreductase subunit NuoF [Planctomycetota bacterium]|nr:NADH-quinone oxidoreductase subunit NuoF [Planctomycetota bacterium]
MPKVEPVLLKHVGVEGSTTFDYYQSHGGYEVARKALTSMKPEEVTEIVKGSGLRGRGGAGFPCGMKWTFVPKDSPKPKYLVVNADESEPGTFKDRVLIENDPHALIEGIILAAYAIGSHTSYIYIRGEFGHPYRVFKRAVEEAYDRGALGKGALSSKWDLDLFIHRGAGAYICGEETALLSSIEGKRGYPKIKPPFPAVEGLFRCPTIVNNVETLMMVPHIVKNGAAWLKQWGTEKSPGLKVFGVSGHVKRPGLYELPLGIPVRELIFEHAGGIRDGHTFKGVIPGGASSGVLTEKELDTKLDFDTLGAMGMILGTAGAIVMDETVCMVDALWNLLRFFHHESCGQCTPCREGTGWLDKMVARIERGEGRKEYIDMMLEVAQIVRPVMFCALADAAAIPTKQFITRFRPEFERHIEAKGCPLRQEAVAARP